MVRWEDYLSARLLKADGTPYPVVEDDVQHAVALPGAVRALLLLCWSTKVSMAELGKSSEGCSQQSSALWERHPHVWIDASECVLDWLTYLGICGEYRLSRWR